MASLSASLLGCEGIFSLTPYQQVETFSVRVRFEAADRFLMELAQRYGLTLNREVSPQQSDEARVYRATILLDRCMFLVDGRGRADDMIMTARFEAVANDSCIGRMQPLVGEAQEGLRRIGR